jgi:hypothetical protein
MVQVPSKGFARRSTTRSEYQEMQERLLDWMRKTAPIVLGADAPDAQVSAIKAGLEYDLSEEVEV